MVWRAIRAWLRPRAATSCALTLATEPARSSGDGHAESGVLAATRPASVVEQGEGLRARRRAVFRADGPQELPPAHLAVCPARRYLVRLRAASGDAPEVGMRLRIHHLADGAAVARDAVVLDAGGRGRLDTRTDTEAVGVEVVLVKGTWAPRRLVVELVEAGDRPLLDSFVLIPGAMKSGTSTLHAYLRQHPQVCPSRRKEPEYFSSERYVDGLEGYRDLFPFDERTHVLGLDASTGYTKHPYFPDVAQRLAAVSASFRFLYMLRDPVDRIESHLAHNVARGRLSPTRALTDGPHLQDTLHVSRYAAQLDCYAAAFPDLAERLLLIDFDELVTAPVPVLRRVEAHLGLPAHDYENVGARNTRRFAHGSDRVRLDAELRARLRSQLAGDLERLIDEYGFEPARRWLPSAGS